MGNGRVLRTFMVVCGSLEIMLFGGIIFGWASLVYIYKEEGYFQHLCYNLSASNDNPTSSVPVDNGYGTFNSNATFVEKSNFEMAENSTVFRAKVLTCSEQDNQFNLVFSISTAFTGIMCFLNGIIYDKLGTRFCRIIAILCFMGAMMCLIFANPERSFLLYPGATLLVYGGYLLLITNLQLANLIPTRRSTIMALYAGSYDCSAVIFLIFKAAHEVGIQVNTCFIIQACMFVVLVSVSTFCTLPVYHLPWPLPENFRVHPPILSLCRKNSDLNQDLEIEGPEREAGIKPDLTENVDSNGNPVHSTVARLRQSTSCRPSPSVRSKVSTSRYFSVSQPEDISSQEYLLAINHVPHLSTSSVNKSYSSKRNLNNALLTPAALLKKKEKYSLSDHHLSLLDISQGQRSMVHRPSVSLNNIDLEALSSTPQIGMLAINHVPNISSRSISRTSMAGSRYLTPISVHGISQASPYKDDTQEPTKGDKSTGQKATSLKKEILSPLFMMQVMWMSFQRLRSWFFVGVFNPWITEMAKGDISKISHFTSVFAAMQFFGIFTAPLNGRLMDRKPGEKYAYHNTKFERLHASIPSFMLNCTVVVLMSIGAAIPVLEVQYVTFALHVLNRSFIYGPNSAFVANAFPFDYFGILLGTTLTLSAIFGMLQYPLFLLIQGPLNNDPKIVNIILIILMTVTYAHPIYICVYLRRKLKKSQVNESAEPLQKNDDADDDVEDDQEDGDEGEEDFKADTNSEDMDEDADNNPASIVNNETENSVFTKTNFETSPEIFDPKEEGIIYADEETGSIARKDGLPQREITEEKLHTKGGITQNDNVSQNDYVTYL